MKRNSVTIVVGAILLLIFLGLLFTYQVRQTEVAVVTTFDRPGQPVRDSGLHWKWPYPIQKVFKFDKRIQSFNEDKLEEVFTQDSYPLIIRVYAGWTIREPAKFFNSFPSGTVTEAEPKLEEVIRTHKNTVVGRHPFADFISAEGRQPKFVEIEREMLTAIQSAALTNFGISVEFLGINKLDLPESVTKNVFDRMTAERQREIDRLRAEGEAAATTIRAEADKKRQDILNAAQNQATILRGQADAQAGNYLQVFNQNPQFAMFLQKLRGIEETLRERTTMVIDDRMSPYDLLTRSFAAGPGATNASSAPAQATLSTNETQAAKR